MPKYVTDQALFNVSLRNACLFISIFSLVTLVLGVIVRPGSLHYSSSLIGFIIELIGGLALLFGVLWSNPWLVLVWLVVAALYFIQWPFAVLGVIFNYGDYRAAAYFNNVILILLEYVIVLLLFGYCTYLVYSYFHHLRNSQSASAHTVVV